MKPLIKTITLLTILILNCIVFQSNSQNVKAPLFSPLPSKEAAAEFLKRPLVLCKREVDPKEAEKLKKKNPEQLKFDEGYNQYFNDAMKLYFDTLFKGSKTIELKSEAEVNALISSGSSNVAIVMASDMSRKFSVGEHTKNQDTYSFRMILPDKKDDELIISFMSNILSDADFVFLVQQINIHLEKIAAGEATPSYDLTNKTMAAKLKDMKLIVNLQKIDNDLTKDEITKNYPYSVEFVDSLASYEDIITGQKPGYAYIAPVWSSTLWGAGYVVVDAGTGEILCIISAGGVNYAIGWRPAKTGNFSMDNYNRKHYSFDVITFKRKYELQTGHFKSFYKLATKG
jgi:hypothetical protein